MNGAGYFNKTNEELEQVDMFVKKVIECKVILCPLAILICKISTIFIVSHTKQRKYYLIYWQSLAINGYVIRDIQNIINGKIKDFALKRTKNLNIYLPRFII